MLAFILPMSLYLHVGKKSGQKHKNIKNSYHLMEELVLSSFLILPF